MKLIYAVRDRAADAFGNPFFFTTQGQAIRVFMDEINRAEPNNGLYIHSEDYDLYRLGTYDETSGEIMAEQPQQIAIGKDLKKGA